MRVGAGSTTHGVKEKNDHRSGDRVATEIPESRSLRCSQVQAANIPRCRAIVAPGSRTSALTFVFSGKIAWLQQSRTGRQWDRTADLAWA
jgi:hypothetical protein